MGVETRGDEEQLGVKFLQPRQNALPVLPELDRGLGLHAQDAFAGGSTQKAAGESGLVGLAKKHARLVQDREHRAVSYMGVDVDHGDALSSQGQRVVGSNGGTID